jgi:adenylate cyclase, class 2
MKEVEVKARVSDLDALQTTIEKLGIKFSKPVTQNDLVFAERLDNFTESLSGVNFLRIRKQGNKTLLTLKRPEANETVSFEREVEIYDAEPMRQIIEFLGFKLAVRVNKKRRQAKHRDLELCLDDVEGLGTFIEVEKMAEENDDSLKIQKELYTFLKQFGITDADRVEDGYDTLVAKKFGHEKN